MERPIANPEYRRGVNCVSKGLQSHTPGGDMGTVVVSACGVNSRLSYLTCPVVSG